MKIRSLPLALLSFTACFFFSGTGSALAQTDNFDDGNSDGWTELNPLDGNGVTGTFSFPGGNTYRMQSSPSPNEGLLGQSRIGALREDVDYTDFYISVDLVDHAAAQDQNIGILARVREPGLGTLDGYGVTYNPTDGMVFFSVITDELGENPADAEVFLDPSTPVRLVFQGKGGEFKFEVFALDDLENAAVTLEVFDETYSSGSCGLFAVTDASDNPFSTDCTFDNYIAAAEEPVEFGIVSITETGDDLEIVFLSRPDIRYVLYKSTDLIRWEEVDDDVGSPTGTQTTLTVTPDAGEKRQYFRIER